MYGQNTVADIEGRIASGFDCLSYFVFCWYKEFSLQVFLTISAVAYDYCTVILAINLHRIIILVHNYFCDQEKVSIITQENWTWQTKSGACFEIYHIIQ